jgi:hypothetical protein
MLHMLNQIGGGFYGRAIQLAERANVPLVRTYCKKKTLVPGFVRDPLGKLVNILTHR